MRSHHRPHREQALPRERGKSATMPRRSAAVAFCLLASFLSPQGADGRAENYVRVWDARSAQVGQLAIYNADPNGAAFGMPVAAGNLDGPDADGISRDDVVVA